MYSVGYNFCNSLCVFTRLTLANAVVTAKNNNFSSEQDVLQAKLERSMSK